MALYARVSTGRQDEENQLLELRAYVATQPDWVASEYVDRLSGLKGRAARAQFDRMLTDASRRKIDLVLFWSLDRFTREGARETLNYLGDLESWGVKFRSYREPYLNNMGPFGPAVVSLLATIANFESKRRGERVRSGLDKARDRGTKSGKAIGGQVRLAGVQPLVLALAAEGLSLRQIAKHPQVLAAAGKAPSLGWLSATLRAGTPPPSA